MATFSFTNLIPDFCQIPSSVVSNLDSCQNITANPAEGISAVFIAVLMIISLAFFLFSFMKFFESQLNVRAYFKLLEGLDQSELANKRRTIKDEAGKKKDYLGGLWREFDESLVLHRDDKGEYRLSNTLDASHFFNDKSLAKGLTGNRLIAAVPGLLTAIGVIGTFAGLQMGLAGIDLSSDSVALLKEGIRNMILGASIAFLTSLWGIGLSVLFNLAEKIMERIVRHKIRALQNHIDFLYPRISAEQSLVDIADTSKIGTEALQGLAEQIGNKMQEAMTQASEVISTGLKDSLNEILSPALEKLAADAHTGSEKALESMLNRFMKKFGQAGEDQRALMDKSSQDVNQAVGQLGVQMTQFLEGLDGQMEGQKQRDNDRMVSFKAQLYDVTEHQKLALSDFSGAVSSQIERQHELDQERNDRANQQMTQMQSSQEGLGERLQSFLDFQRQSHKQLYEELRVLQTGFQQVSKSNHEATEKLTVSSGNMQSAASKLSSLGTSISEAADSLSTMVDRATNSTNELSQRNIAAVEQLKTVLNQYQQFAGEVRQTSENLRLATEHAESGFASVDQHLQQFQQSMEKQVNDMQEQMQNLMVHFAEQVKTQTVERIQVWTDETSKYTSEMTRAISTIADVVDDIEGKVGTVQ
jgi:hypothetical protein